MADLTFRREPRMGAWWDNKVTIYFNTDAQKLGFTSNCATCFLLLLQPITGEMELNQGSFWAFNRDVYCMPVTDEAHTLQIVEQVAPIFERFGVEMETLHVQQ